ncbi:MAG: type II secretion system F family protein [Candidatus Omnitrophota bacterium]
MKFDYKAKKGVNEVVEGVIEASSQNEALDLLGEQGLFPISVEAAVITFEQKQAQAKKKSYLKKLKIFSKKVNSRQILIFVRKLSTLIRAEVDLLQALRIIYEQTEHEAFQKVILSLYSDVKEGRPFSEALSKYPQYFSSLFMNIIKSGEASGLLTEALNQISEHLARADNLKRKITAALAYPGLLLMVGFISVFVLINFVIPRLGNVFESMGQELPLMTKLILEFSDFSAKNSGIVIGIILGSVLAIIPLKGLYFFKIIGGRIKRKMPIVKGLIKNQELAQFAVSLYLLLKSGISILESLKVAALTVEDPVLKKELISVYQQVTRGETLANSFSSFTSMPDFFTKMIAVGEESGKLPEVLEEVAHSYTQEVEASITLISSLLEPVLILVLGLILGVIVLSILLPTFQITQMVR